MYKTKLIPALLPLLLLVVTTITVLIARKRYKRRRAKTLRKMLRDDKAKYILNYLLKQPPTKWKEPDYLGLTGIYSELGKRTTTAFDNRSGDLNVETFPIESHAIAWLNNEFDMSDYQAWSRTKRN